MISKNEKDHFLFWKICMDCINVVVHIEKSDHASDNHLVREFSQHDFFHSFGRF